MINGERHYIGIAFMASLLLHIALLAYFRDALRTAPQTPAVHRPIDLVLRPYTTATTAPPMPATPGRRQPAVPLPKAGSDKASPSAQESASERAMQFDEPVSGATGVPARRSVPLNLSLPEPDARGGPGDSPSSGLATRVFDRSLADRIVLQRQRVSGRAQTPPRAGGGSMQGDRWESFVNIGDLCFRVLEADPLDSLSREQWFPVACE